MSGEKRLREAFAVANDGDTKALLDYCRSLNRTLQAKGYRVIHGNAIQKVLDGDLDDSLPSSLYDYVQATDKIADESAIVAGCNALAHKDYKLVLLPECTGLVEVMADKNGLNAQTLRDAGLKDLHIYAGYFIHEASHVIGLSGRYWQGGESFRFNEVDTYLHEFTRLMRVADFETGHHIPNFLASRKTMQNIIACLIAIDKNKHKDTDLRYQYTHSAAEWAITHANKPAEMQGLWNKDKDRFYLKRLRQHVPAYSMQKMNGQIRHDNAYVLALHQLKDVAGHDETHALMDQFPDRYTMRDDALRAAKRCLRFGYIERQFDSPDEKVNSAKGTMPSEEAALILRRLARSIDHLKRYADDYRPPAEDLKITHRCRVPQPG